MCYHKLYQINPKTAFSFAHLSLFSDRVHTYYFLHSLQYSVLTKVHG